MSMEHSQPVYWQSLPPQASYVHSVSHVEPQLLRRAHRQDSYQEGNVIVSLLFLACVVSISQNVAPIALVNFLAARHHVPQYLLDNRLGNGQGGSAQPCLERLQGFPCGRPLLIHAGLYFLPQGIIQRVKVRGILWKLHGVDLQLFLRVFGLPGFVTSGVIVFQSDVRVVRSGAGNKNARCARQSLCSASAPLSPQLQCWISTWDGLSPKRAFSFPG